MNATRLGPHVVVAAGRLLQVIALLLACTLVVFTLQELAGVDPGRAILGVTASQEAVDEYNRSLGLDRPLIVQYLRFLGGVVTGDFGISFYSRSEVSAILLQRIGPTLALMGLSMVFSLLASVPLTMAAVRRPGRVADNIGRVLALGGTVLPTFWLAIILIVVIALPTGLFPIGGWGTTLPTQLQAAFLPSLTLAIGLMPLQIRTLRTTLLHEMGSLYVEAARSRGVGEWRLIAAHALRNSVAPLIAVSAVQIGGAIFRTVVVENTFRIPGLGLGLIQAVGQQDMPVVNATTLILAFFVVIVSLLSDWITMLLNPKLRRTTA